MERGHRVTALVSGACLDCGRSFRERERSLPGCRLWPAGMCLPLWWEGISPDALAEICADHWYRQARRIGLRFADWCLVQGDAVVCARFAFTPYREPPQWEQWEVRYGLSRAGYISGRNVIRAFPAFTEEDNCGQ